MKNTLLRSFFVGYILVICSAHLSAAAERGIWVTRYDYKTTSDVIKIAENVRYLGATQVFFQVRGNATVCYPSKIEPWAWEMTGDTPKTIGKDPGWDPLAKALEEVQKRNMELHAWLNVFPGWRGVIPAPRGTRQPWVTHRSWFMIDHRGVLLRPSKSFYSFMSPGHPQVRSYTASIFGELAKNYPKLDGLHMDYVRYPGRKEVGRFRDFSYDKESVKAFQRQYKKKPHYAQPEWQRFKCEQVNASIRAIRKAIHLTAPQMDLSATCFANIDSATEEKGQDPRDWFEDDLVDWVIPMAYERNSKTLATRLEKWNESFDPKWRKQMLIGLNVDFNKESEIRRQLNSVQKQDYGGLVVFAYTSLFPNHKANRKAKMIRDLWHEEQLRDLLRKTSGKSAVED